MQNVVFQGKRLHGLEEVALADLLPPGRARALCDFQAPLQAGDGVVAGSRQVGALLVYRGGGFDVFEEAFLFAIVPRSLFFRHS